MAISLSKGGNISLTKTAPSMVKLDLGLGWDVRATDGAAFDLDASAFMVGENGKTRSEADFIFYKQLCSADGSIKHSGDNRTGDGDGDDETLSIDLSKIPADVAKIVICASIDEADTRKQSFGQVSNAYIRAVNTTGTTEELARFDLSEDSSTETAMIFGELYRHGEEWKFKAIGQGFNGGLAALAANFGLDVK